jgi:hypothetical protein
LAVEDRGKKVSITDGCGVEFGGGIGGGDWCDA